MSVAFRQPVFKNPVPAIWKAITTTLMGIFMSMVAAGEVAGRARAAQYLASMGYYDEAKKVMLQKDLT